MAEQKPYQDIPMSDLRKHLGEINIAIANARADLDKYRVTAVNEHVYLYLKKAQDAMDVLLGPVALHEQCVVNGQELHGYSQICYKIHDNYYGLKQFGHTHCERIAQEQVPISAEEFLVFKYRVPHNAVCKGCGKPILPAAQEEEK